MVVLIILSVLAWTPLVIVSGLRCPLQDTGNAGVDAVSLCPMCSESIAAVRWNASGDFEFMRLRYICRHPNNSNVHKLNFNAPQDSCFTRYPNPLTGSTAVGYELWEGINCEFRLQYRIFSVTRVKSVNCTVKSSQTCEANPQECHVDNLQVMNEAGECPTDQCAEGYTGNLCNNINECQNNDTCDENADCHDTDGSYQCKCLPGFQGDGYNCTDINECETVNETCSNENAECVNTVGNYSCQCKPGYTGDSYSCTDIDECTVEEFPCPNDTVCINSVGSYHCDANDWSNGRVEVVSGVVTSTLLLLLLLVLVLTVTLIVYRKHFKRKRVFPFQEELMKTELDPYYSPKFWTCSLSSIHSTYERVGIYGSTTYIKRTEQLGNSQMDTSSLSGDSGLPEGVPHAHQHPSHPEDESFSSSPHIPSTQKSIALRLPPDTKASPHKDDTFPNGRISARNYMFDEMLPSILLHSQEDPLTQEPTAPGGYIQECDRSHQITGSGTNTPEDGTQVGAENGSSGVYLIENDTLCTSGYSTTSTAEDSVSSGTGARVNTYISNEENHTHCVVAASMSSSGYSTERVGDDICSPTDTSCNGLKIWRSRTSLRSDDTIQMTDLGEGDLDNIKFTFNPHQEYEYINAVGKDFCTNVSFQITT